MSDEIQFGVSPDGEDKVNRLIRSVDTLTSSLKGLAENNWATKLVRQVDLLEAQVKTGLTEVRMVMQDGMSKIRSEVEKSDATLLRERQRAAERQMALERRVQLDRLQFLSQTLERQVSIEEKAAEQSWRNLLDLEVRKLAAQKRAEAERLASIEATAKRQRAIEEQAAATSWRNYLDLEARKMSVLEQQRSLNTKFITSPLSAQIGIAEKAAVYSNLGGDAAAKYGSAAAAADLAALRTQYAAMKGAVDSSSGAIKHHNEMMKDGHALARGLSGSLGALWMTYGSLAPLAAGAALGASLKNVVSVGKEIEYQLKFVQALGNSPVDLGKFLSITEGTVVSVKEAAEGMRALAQSGLDTQQALHALPTVLNLAVVGEMSVGAAALAATGAVQAFGMSLDNIGHVGDVFAQVAASSNTSVALLTESMKQASTVAQVYNVSLEETGSALGVLAKQNITGSAAGTAYTNMLTGLYSPTKQAADALKRLNIDTSDASGGLKNSTQLIRELRVALSGLNDSARADVLNDIFTNRGAKAFAAIAANIGLYIDGIEQARNSTGMMTKAVMVLEDSTEGAFKRLKNSVSGSFAKAFDQAGPSVQMLIDKMAHLAASDNVVKALTNITNVVTGTINVLVEHGKIITAVAATYALLTPAKAIFTALGGSMVAVTTAQAALTAGTLSFGVAARGVMALLGPIGIALALATTAYIALTAATDKQEAADQRLRNSMASNIEFLQRETEAINKKNEALDRKAGITPTEVKKDPGEQLVASLEARVKEARAGLGRPGGNVADIAAYQARSGALLALEEKLAEARRQSSEMSNAQSAYDKAAKTESNKIARNGLLEQLELIKRKGEVEMTIEGRRVPIDPLGNEASRAIAAEAAGWREKLLAGTATQKQVEIAILDINQRYNASLSGGNKVSGDMLKTQLQRLELEKQLFDIRNRTELMQAAESYRTGDLGELEYIQKKLELEKSALTVAAQTALKEAQQVRDAEGKQAAMQKYANLAATAREKSKQLDVQAEIAKNAYIDDLRQKRLADEAEGYERQGDLATAALAKFQAQHGRELEKLQNDLQNVDLDALKSAMEVDPSDTVALKAYNAALEQTLRFRNLLAQQESGVRAGEFGQTKQKFDAALATLRGSLEEAKAAAGEDGLAGMLGLGDAALQLREGVLPGVVALVDELQAMAAQKDAPAEFIKAAGEAARAVGKIQQELTKSANPFGQAWKDVWKSVESSAHDAWMSIGEEGNSVFRSIGKTIKTAIMEMLYQLTVKKWILNIGASFSESGLGGGLAAIGSLLGGSGGNAAAGAGGALGSALNLVSAAKNLYGMVSGGVATTIGGGITSIGNMLGSQSISGFGMGVGGWGQMAAPYASPGSISAGATVGSIGQVLGGVAGGVFGGRAISNGYSAFGGSGNGTVNTGTAIGAAVGSIVPVIGTALGALVGGLLGGAVNRLFGHKKPEVTSEGIRGTLSETGATGEAYQNWLAKGGWFRSDKRGTNTTQLADDLKNSLSSGFLELQTATAGFAQTLGLSADSIKGYTKSFDITLDSKDPTKNTEALTKFFTDLGDELATRVMPTLSEFQKVGESASVTLQRLAGDFQVTTAIAQMLGKTSEQAFGAAGLASLAAREQLINLSGGIDVLSANVTSYAQNFLTDAEKIAPVQAALAEAFKAMNIAAPTTRAEFKALVSGLDLTNVEQIKTFNSLMALQGAFAQVHPALDDLADSVTKTVAQIADERKSLQDQLDQFLPEDQLLTKQRNALDASNRGLFDQIQAHKLLQEAYENESEALQNAVTRNEQFAKSLRSFRDQLTLGDLSTLTPLQKYAEARRQFMDTLVKARGGDETAQGNFQSAAQAFLEASRVANASDPTYQADFEMVRSATEQTAQWAEKQVDVNKSMLEQLKQSVSGLVRIEQAIGSVSAALISLQSAGGSLGTDTLRYAIEGMYQTLLGRASDASGMQFWLNAANSGVSLSSIESSFKTSPEYLSKVSPVQAYESASTMTVQALQSLQASVDGLRAEQAEQTAAQIGATLTAAETSANTIVDGTEQALQQASRAAQNEPLVPQ